MNGLAILIGLGPMFGWGFFPTISSKIGGKPANQILGATLATTVLATVMLFIRGIGVPTGLNLMFGLISGLGWGFGQIMQFKGFELVGSSRIMPLSTAFQLILTALWGVFALGNWEGTTNKIIGLTALLVIIIGATLTSYTQKTPNTKNSGDLKKAIMYQLVGSIGYWLFSAAPQVCNMPAVREKFPSLTIMDGSQAFFPQAIGMLLCAIIYGLTQMKNGNVFNESVSYRQMIAGFFTGFGMLMYLISAQPSFNGLATAFVLGQMAVIVSTLTGIYFLKQKKTPKEMLFTYIGLGLIVISAAVTAFL